MNPWQSGADWHRLCPGRHTLWPRLMGQTISRAWADQGRLYRSERSKMGRVQVRWSSAIVQLIRHDGVVHGRFLSERKSASIAPLAIGYCSARRHSGAKWRRSLRRSEHSRRVEPFLRTTNSTKLRNGAPAKVRLSELFRPNTDSFDPLPLHVPPAPHRQAAGAEQRADGRASD